VFFHLTENQFGIQGYQRPQIYYCDLTFELSRCSKVSWMLAVCLGYGLLPVFAAFRTVLRSRKGKPSLRRPIGLGVGPP
jgi:hypothetical protein